MDSDSIAETRDSMKDKISKQFDWIKERQINSYEKSKHNTFKKIDKQKEQVRRDFEKKKNEAYKQAEQELKQMERQYTMNADLTYKSVQKVVHSLASFEHPKSAKELQEFRSKLGERNDNIHKWLSKPEGDVEDKMRGDKFKLVEKLGFSEEELQIVNEIVRTQDKIQKSLVSQFETFL